VGLSPCVGVGVECCLRVCASQGSDVPLLLERRRGPRQARGGWVASHVWGVCSGKELSVCWRGSCSWLLLLDTTNTRWRQRHDTAAGWGVEWFVLGVQDVEGACMRGHARMLASWLVNPPCSCGQGGFSQLCSRVALLHGGASASAVVEAEVPNSSCCGAVHRSRPCSRASCSCSSSRRICPSRGCGSLVVVSGAAAAGRPQQGLEHICMGRACIVSSCWQCVRVGGCPHCDQ
jgi:hypothetical protein